MASRTVDVTLVSARDLRDVNLVSKMEVYAVVYLAGDPMSRQRIATDRTGGCNPAWNATVRVTVPASGAGSGALRVLLRTERPLGDRDVGEVILPLNEILAGAGDEPIEAELGAYKVCKVGSSKTHGVLNLSYMLGGVIHPPAAYYQHHAAVVKTGEPAAGYLAAGAAPYASAPPRPPPPQQLSYSYPYPCPPPTMTRPLRISSR
ncbi:protein SRC2-like [Lolium rigidum]|uniref:protein SRC2-like n=1 Tax=Lolium rigidum TaxID=89674 RepID=UPI001F5E035B|nr:protein SRC2-like [Lolium rigidum]